MSFDAYIAAQQENIQQVRRMPQFTELVLPIHELYSQAVRLVPPTSRPYFGRLLLLSHRTFMSAATLALRALPDDAGAVTRRALEAARLAIAIKYEPENLALWIGFEQRMARWKSRRRGERPKEQPPALKHPPQHQVYEDLGRLVGILSDAAAHFTPEFFNLHSFRVETGAGDSATVGLNYFIDDPRLLEQGLSALAAEHYLCLQAFDYCYDGAFSSDLTWMTGLRNVQESGRRLAPPPEPDEQEEKT